MENLAIYCADIGSIRSGSFAWARAESTPQAVSRGLHIQQLVDQVVADLSSGKPVALGFECPLFIPISDEPLQLGCARSGEGDRSWSGGAGPAVLASGLAQVVWILRGIRRSIGSGTPAFLEWNSFHRAGSGLFVWEAFVSSSGKGQNHADDAEIAVRAFLAALPDLNAANAIQCKTEVHSLAGAAILRTGWSDDVQLLSRPCIVIKARGAREQIQARVSEEKTT